MGSPTIIAEVGVLTFGSKDIGKMFVDEAANIGISMLKFQCLTPDNIVNKDLDEFWYTRLKSRALSKKDFIEIMEYGKTKGVTCFASTHNEYDLMELSEAGMEYLKIGAGDSNNIRMLDMALSTGKKVFWSLGLLDLADIVELLDSYNLSYNTLIPMWCVSKYPTKFKETNLRMLKFIKDLVPEMEVGYSDHTVGYTVPLIVSTFTYIKYIEKHFKLDFHTRKKYDSMDIDVSLNPEEFKNFLKDKDAINFSMHKMNNDVCMDCDWAKKGVAVNRDMKKGDVIVSDDLITLRPYKKELGHISADKFYTIVGKTLTEDVNKGCFINSLYLL